MSENQRKKIGILTSGGDCPGLNAVIRAVVKGNSCRGESIKTQGLGCVRHSLRDRRFYADCRGKISPPRFDPDSPWL